MNAPALNLAPSPVRLWTDTPEVRALIGRIKLNPPTKNVRQLASYERWSRDEPEHYVWYTGELVDRLDDARRAYLDSLMVNVDAARGTPAYASAVEALYAQPSLNEVIEAGWTRSAMGGR